VVLVLAGVLALEPSRPARMPGTPGAAPALAQEPPAELAQLFPETGLTVAGDFLRAWQAGGGVATLGLPITAERPEIGEDGHLVRVQWFERARLEQAPAGVQLGLLGREVLAGRALAAATPEPAELAQLFPETGYAVAEPFLSFWEANGGLAVFGYPITGLVREVSPSDGRSRLVQYFERARFEDHGEEASPRVQLGLVGREALARPVRLWWEAEEAQAHTFTTAFVFAGGGLGRDQALYVDSSDPAADGGPYRAHYRVRVPRPDTYTFWGHLLALDEASLLRWRVNDGAWQSVDRWSPPLGMVDLQPPHRYAWYQLGALVLPAGWHTLEVEVVAQGAAVAGLDAFLLTTDPAAFPSRAGTLPAQVAPPVATLRAALAGPAATWPRLHRGLAQGGEQRDPAYLARAAGQLRALNVRYIRLDHIFDYYDVIRRGPGRRFTYDFSRLDAALDAVLASGAQPFLSLGLTPALLSPSGAENAPPNNLAAWRDLVTATVRHVNGARGLGVRYWEVWNEPNLTPFWSGSFQDYAQLYEVTAAAVVAADPNARVGGPATSGHEYWVRALIDHAAATGARLDFISWHTYHVRPAMLANQVALVRRELARYPRFRDTELMLTEWSLHSDFGANAGYVSDTHVAAAYVAAAVHTLADASVSQALFFEAVDGPPPPGQVAWGRWGALTYDGRPKPVYHALTALNRLHDWRLPATSSEPRLGLLATRQGDRLALLVWHLAPEGQGPQATRLILADPPAGLTALRRWTVDAAHSPLGGELAEVAPVTGALADGAWVATLTLAPDSVTLLTWEP
jgi:beta-xylosidase